MRGFLYILFLCLPGAHIAFAQDTLKTVTIFSIKSNSVTPVQTLNGVALERMNSLSVADAARYFSGVQLKDYGGLGGLKTLDVHSMGSNHLGVFYDGIELGNAQNGTVDLGRFSLDNIEQMDLYNAQKGVIFQPAKGFASAASIYLQSRKPVFKGDEQTHGKVSFKTGSFGLINPSVRLEQKVTDHIAATFSSEWTHGDGQYKFRYTNGTYDTTAIRKNAAIDAWRIEGGLSGQFKDSSTWTLKTYYYNSSRGLPGAIVSNVFQRPQYQWDRNFFVQSSYNKKIGKYSTMINARYGYDYVRYRDPDIVTIDGILINRYRQHEYYISSANQYKLTSFWDVALSADFQVNEMTAVNLDHFAIPTRYTTLLALASQLHFKRLDVQGSLLATIVNETTKLYAAASNQREYTPTIITSWQPFNDPAFRVRSFYKSIFRMPTFNDLYYGTIGNTTLKPEYTKQYDAGFSYTRNMPGLWQYLSIQVDGYYNNVTDKIIAVPGGKQFRWTMQNIGKADIYGLDAGIQTALHSIASVQTDFSLKYTYQRAMDVTSPGEINYKDQIAYVPLHSGSFVTHASWKNYDINYSFIYVGARNSQGYESPANYIEPWYTSDISLLTHFNYGKKTVKLSCEVNNLLNQYYDVVINYPMPGRYYRFAISINY
jgi:vitamin B12 transporter